MKYSLILPIYKPQENWVSVVSKNLSEIANIYPEDNIHLILVDDGTPLSLYPENENKLEQHVSSFTFINYATNKGKGHALRKGFAEAKEKYAIFTDIDFPYDMKSFKNIREALKSGNGDIISGKRTTEYYENLPLLRNFISQMLSRSIKLIFGLKNGQSQVGIKGFNEKGINAALNTSIDRYLFDMELFLIAERDDLIIDSAPVKLKRNISFRSMPLSVLLQESGNFWYLFKQYRLGV